MKKLALSGKYGKGKFALVDDEDFDEVNKYSWNLRRVYVVRTGRSGNKQFPVYLHRHIMKANKGEIIDHTNRDALDNRKKNLRVCTQSQNLANSIRRKNNKSGYKGVIWDKTGRKWRAGFMKDGKWTHLGMFSCKKKAAKVYGEHLKKHFGEFARV